MAVFDSLDVGFDPVSFLSSAFGDVFSVSLALYSRVGSLFLFYIDDLDSFDLSFDPCFECTSMPTAPAVEVLFALAGKRGHLGSSSGDLSSDPPDPCAARCRVAFLKRLTLS